MKMVRTLCTVGLLLSTAAGCGSKSATALTPLVSNVNEAVAAGDCVPLEGPYTLPSGAEMSYSIIDADDADDMDVAVIDDAAGCAFSEGYGVALDVASVNARTGPVPAGDYDFVVHCNNLIYDCVFRLTWTASY